MPNKRLPDELVGFGARVREFREERGLTQAELGDLAGLHRTYIGGVERGERNLGLQNVHTIARALQLEVADLFPPAGDETGSAGD